MLSVIYGAPWRCGIWTTRYRFRHPHAQATRHISSRFTLKELHQRRVLRANSATDVLAFTCSGYSTMSMSNGLPVKQAKTEDRAVSKFREYLRINTVQPDPDYGPAIKFLQDYAKELNLTTNVTEIVQGNPILVMTWTGVDPSLPTVLLNSHMDVVPVYPEHWKYDPFEAVKEDNGNIYARGSQDMKCVGIQYLEAIRKLQSKGVKLLRTIHISFVPDEEVGGHRGMELFVDHEDFKKLNVAFAMDEGLANEGPDFKVYYAERAPWWMQVTCTGQPGHGSAFIENTAAEKLRRVINSFLDYRAQQEKILKSNPQIGIGSVNTVNFTLVKGGVQPNVVPSEMTATFDMRITPSQNLSELEAEINQWLKEAGENITMKFLQKNMCQAVTSTDDTNPWWMAFKGACDSMGLQIKTEVFPAATDSRYIRAGGLPALGFSPMNNTPILLHDHNEFLNENIFLRGIDIYCEILPAIANVPA